METQAASLLQTLPTLAIDEGLGATTIELIAGLGDTSGRVMFELALLQTRLGEGTAKAATQALQLAGVRRRADSGEIEVRKPAIRGCAVCASVPILDRYGLTVKRSGAALGA
jgi:hypothetical protein